MTEPDYKEVLESERSKVLLFDEAVTFFYHTPLGRDVLKKITDLELHFVNELRIVDAKNVDKVQYLQNELWRCSYFKVWLADIINDGKAVLDLKEQYDDDLEGLEQDE